MSHKSQSWERSRTPIHVVQDSQLVPENETSTPSLCLDGTQFTEGGEEIEEQTGR